MLNYLHIKSPRRSVVVKNDDDVVELFSFIKANLAYLFRNKNSFRKFYDL